MLRYKRLLLQALDPDAPTISLTQILDDDLAHTVLALRMRSVSRFTHRAKSMVTDRLDTWRRTSEPEGCDRIGERELGAVTESARVAWANLFARDSVPNAFGHGGVDDKSVTEGGMGKLVCP